MKNLSTIVLIIFSFLTNFICLSQQDTATIQKSNLTVGDKIDFHSEILDEKRTLNIYLPHGYSPDSTRTYPIIYLLDGSIDQDFLHISGLVQFGSYSWINMLPESIVVGISNVDRKKDFTFPTSIEKDKNDFPTTGSSKNFIDFIANEVQPLVEKNYKTDTINTIIGQSLGGLLATEILLKKPDLFDNYIIISPSLWWDNQSLLSQSLMKKSKPKSVYIGVGKEGRIIEKTAKKLFKKVKPKQNENWKVHFEYFANQNHGDILHVSVYSAFDKLFGEKN